MSTDEKKTAKKGGKKAAGKGVSTLKGKSGGIKPVKVVTVLFALIKMSGIGITEISGKLGGSVFARNKGGAVVRNRVVPNNPQTTAQQAVRAIFGAISSAWRALSEEARNSWNAIAQDYPVQNRLGEQKILSGKALFQKLNNNLLYAGQALKTLPDAPEGVNAPIAFDNTVMLVDAGVLDTVNIEALLAESGDTSTILVFEATPPLSPGIKNANARFVRIGQAVSAGTGSSFSSAAGYVDVFGEPPIGSQVQWRVFSVNPNTGEKSAYLKTSVTVESA